MPEGEESRETEAAIGAAEMVGAAWIDGYRLGFYAGSFVILSLLVLFGLIRRAMDE